MDAMLAGFTLEHKIGQLMMIGFDGTRVDDDLRRMIAEYHVGGVILFGRNVESPQQVACLTRDLQIIAVQSGHPGLLIAIDQEGGRVARLTENTGFTEFPSAMALTATGDPHNAYRMAAAMATEMRAVGVNVDFAPDLDVNNNPANPIIGPRSFGSNPAQVIEYGLAFGRGLQDHGVLAFGKHFPGHGDTSVDSHVDLPLVPHDRARLEAVELAPFRAAIAAGFAGMMTAHVTFPAIDPTPGLAATLSRPALTGLLRGELGYAGLIVTDSLEMGALSANGCPPPVGAPLALAAGADLLLFNRDHEMHRAVIAALLQAVRRGMIPLEQVEASLRRVWQAKQRFGVLTPSLADPAAALGAVLTAAHLALSRQIARQSLTLARDPRGLLPLAEAPLLIEPPALRGLMTSIAPGALVVEIDAQPGPEQIERLAQTAGPGPRLAAVYDLDHNPQQAALVEALVQAGQPVIVLACRNPYDLARLPAAATALVSYGFNPPVREALADLLAGKCAAAGVLPAALIGA